MIVFTISSLTKLFLDHKTRGTVVNMLLSLFSAVVRVFLLKTWVIDVKSGIAILDSSFTVDYCVLGF